MNIGKRRMAIFILDSPQRRQPGSEWATEFRLKRRKTESNLKIPPPPHLLNLHHSFWKCGILIRILSCPVLIDDTEIISCFFFRQMCKNYTLKSTFNKIHQDIHFWKSNQLKHHGTTTVLDVLLVIASNFCVSYVILSSSVFHNNKYNMHAMQFWKQWIMICTLGNISWLIFIMLQCKKLVSCGS